MMPSLRARLLAAVLALTAVGLLLLGGITYAEQRSFLYDRLDQQLHDQIDAVPGMLGRGRIGDPDDGHAPPPGGGRRPSFGLPPGTYVQMRDASGNVLAEKAVETGGQTVTARPDLAADLPLGRVTTVDGKKGAGTRYRVLAAVGMGGDG